MSRGQSVNFMKEQHHRILQYIGGSWFVLCRRTT